MAPTKLAPEQLLLFVLDTFSTKLINCTPSISTSSGCRITYTVPFMDKKACSTATMQISNDKLASGSVFPVGISKVTYSLIEDGQTIDQCDITIDIKSNLSATFSKDQDGNTIINIQGGDGNYDLQLLDNNKVPITDPQFIEKLTESDYLLGELEENTYYLSITDGRECQVLQSIDITTSLEAANKAFAQQVNIFPNPTSGQVNLQFDLERTTPVRIDIFDIGGKRILSRNNLQIKGDRVVYDLSNNPSGIYNLRVVGKHAYFNYRIVLSKP